MKETPAQIYGRRLRRKSVNHPAPPAIAPEDQADHETGLAIIEALGLYVRLTGPDKGRVGTTWGTKTPAGLARTLRNQFPLKATVEVSGGVAEVTDCPDGVEIEIIDHDNDNDPDLSDAGPFATAEDTTLAAELKMTVEELRGCRWKGTVCHEP